jgi:gamma-glutamylcyclotransferase (GGCT)/AIG2-like uncharacterized protein YtfP
MHLFTYGTLMFPEIWQAVVGKDFKTTPAHLPGHEIYRVRNAVYPGIIAAPNHSLSENGPLGEHSGSRPSTLDSRLSSVPGLLYLNLDEESLERLDAFEDDFYRRRPIRVTCEDGRALDAEAYIVPPESAHLLTDEPWTPQEFQARGNLAEFVSRYSGFNRLS